MSIMEWYAQGLFGTILIECLLAFVLGVRGWRNIARLAVVQALTNPLVLSVVSFTLRYCEAGGMPYLTVVAVMEVSVVFLEAGLILALISPEDMARARIHNALLMSVTLNATSFLLGNQIMDFLSMGLGFFW